jgi:hypothetical protein
MSGAIFLLPYALSWYGTSISTRTILIVTFAKQLLTSYAECLRDYVINEVLRR